MALMEAAGDDDGCLVVGDPRVRFGSMLDHGLSAGYFAAFT